MIVFLFLGKLIHCLTCVTMYVIEMTAKCIPTTVYIGVGVAWSFEYVQRRFNIDASKQ